MLCALTTPSPEERTDLGEMDPLIVLINFMDGETISPCAGVAEAQSETTKNIGKNFARIT
jgi:hypothetical protein